MAKKGPKPQDPIIRFRENIDKNGPIHPILLSPCWIWKGHKNGYGYIWNGKRMIGVHRFSYEIHYGPVPKGKLICHKCDIPLCCNPEHLFSGTHQDNTLDCVSKNRHRKNYNINGELNPSAKLTEGEVLEIRKLANTNMPRKQIAITFGVSLPLIEKIISRSIWKHI